MDAFVNKYQGDCFLFNERFPGGFRPLFGINMYDGSGVFGVQGTLEGGLRWDVSASFGLSKMDYMIRNTVNPSMGPDSPVDFRQRDFVQREYGVNLEMSYPWEVGFLESPLNVAWGGVWRTEIFQIRPGDEASWIRGPYADQGFSVGPSGDQGIPPRFAGTWARPNVGAYVDLEADISESILLNVAGRYENFYQNFGGTITGKVAGLWHATEWLGIRGSVSTGYRAPTPGQANLQNVQTNFGDEGGLILAAQLPATHPIAVALGGKELTEETARSYTVGAVGHISDEIKLTVDYFSISIQDRIALSGSIRLSDEMADILNASPHKEGFEALREIKMFSNDFSTRTRGLDVLFSLDREWSDGRATILSAAYNYTRPTLLKFSEPRLITEFLGTSLENPTSVSILSPRRKIELANVNPLHRIILTGRQIKDPVYAVARLHYYSSWKACLFFAFSCTYQGTSGLLNYDGSWVIDLEFGYTWRRVYRASIGVNNLFAVAPDASPIETNGQGNLHPGSTPWDYNGAAYYLRLSANF